VSGLSEFQKEMYPELGSFIEGAHNHEVWSCFGSEEDRRKYYRERKERKRRDVYINTGKGYIITNQKDVVDSFRDMVFSQGTIDCFNKINAAIKINEIKLTNEYKEEAGKLIKQIQENNSDSWSNDSHGLMIVTKCWNGLIN